MGGSAQKADLILADEIEAAAGGVGQYEHITDAAEHRRVPDQERTCRQRHGLPACNGLVAVARRGLHRRRAPRRARTARMQRLPEQALELVVIRRRCLALRRRDRERHRRQRAQCPLRNVQRQLPPRRFAYHARADCKFPFASYPLRTHTVPSVCGKKNVQSCAIAPPAINEIKAVYNIFTFIILTFN